MRFSLSNRWLRPLATLWLLLGALPAVNANRLAAAYERVAFYYVYREAVMTWGVYQNKYFRDNSALGIDCFGHGTHQFGGCNIVQFLNYLNPLSPVGSTLNSISNLDNPDPHAVAAKLAGSVFLTNLFDTTRILPHADKYEKLIGGTENLMKLIYNTLADRNQVSALGPTRQKIKTALDEVLALRTSDMAVKLQTDLPARFPGLIPFLIETDYAHPGDDDPNRKIKTLDLAKTIELSPIAALFTTPNDLQEWAGEYGDDDPPDLTGFSLGVLVVAIKRWKTLIRGYPCMPV
ncbi:hypothetical protein QBC34DRAFT_437552 [Podospora aff. communis PSN243]|uniref:Uncharacterized protein n=1 Tax=Podospora aff. communis PSN243 TaxID=3040156 RepID=A0AAV9GPY9_9PEZI|nr:hypothetical protein QBC34DRAFT_437552 [Podospora aff. communis PSN243]